MAYDWYSACLNIEEKDKLGASPLLDLLKRAMNSDDFVPFVSEEWKGEDWDLMKTLVTINRNFPVAPFFSVDLTGDPLNTSLPIRITVSIREMCLFSYKWLVLGCKENDSKPLSFPEYPFTLEPFPSQNIRSHWNSFLPRISYIGGLPVRRNLR